MLLPPGEFKTRLRVLRDKKMKNTLLRQKGR
jgi:hypothetical protein